MLEKLTKHSIAQARESKNRFSFGLKIFMALTSHKHLIKAPSQSSQLKGVMILKQKVTASDYFLRFSVLKYNWRITLYKFKNVQRNDLTYVYITKWLPQ